MKRRNVMFLSFSLCPFGICSNGFYKLLNAQCRNNVFLFIFYINILK